MVRIHRRDEIPVSDTWDLGQLFHVEEDYQRVLNGVRTRYLRYSEFKGYLGPSAVRLADYLEFDASIDLRFAPDVPRHSYAFLEIFLPRAARSGQE